MIRDITLGQYFPGNSLLHKADARIKIVITVLFIVALFICRNFVSLFLLAVIAAASVAVSKISVRTIMKGMRMLVIILLFTSAMQIIYNTEGTVLWKPFENHDFAVTTGGIYAAVFLIFRIAILIVYSSLLTYTTSPTVLTDAIERLLSPLKYLHVNVHALSMMMTIALRFIPTLIEEINIIMNAQKARGADLESGNIIARAKALVPIFVPLFVNSFRRAYELAFAMECRCYNGSNTRTRMKIMKMSARDYILLFSCIFLIAAVVFFSFFAVRILPVLSCGNYSILFESVI